MRFAAWLCVTLAVILAGPSAGQSLDEVPEGHWAYQTIDALMRQGLVHGYPAAAYSGPAPLTRAEMAGLTARAVRGVGEALQQHGLRLQQLAQAPGDAPGLAEAVAPAPPVSQEDLARIDKLLAEFRNELVVMGAKVDAIAAELTRLRSALAETRAEVRAVAAEVARHRIAGYTQARYTVDGSATPEADFSLPRVRVGMSGPLGERSAYLLELDVPSQRQPGDSTAIITQAYAALDLGGARLLAGQFPTPFGWELFAPPRTLEAPEASLGVRRLLPDQRFERGLRLEGPLGPKWRGWLAVVSGAGYRRGDTNERKDVALRLARVGDALEYGVSAYYGEDSERAAADAPRLDARRRLGNAFVAGRFGRGLIKGEVIAGRAGQAGLLADGAKDVLAWTVLGGYAPRSHTLLAARFHRFDPDRDRAGDRTDTTAVMWLRRLDQSVRLRVAEEFVRPQAGGAHEVFTAEVQIEY